MSDEDRVEEPTILEETEGLSGQDGPNLSAGDASRTSEGDVHEKEITSVVGDPPQDADHVGDIPADTGRLEQSEQDIEPEASSDFVANDQNVHTPEGGDVVETGGHPEDEIRSELRPISDPADAASGPAGEAGEGGNATQVEELETADQSDEVDEDFFEPDVISVEDVSGEHPFAWILRLSFDKASPQP